MPSPEIKRRLCGLAAFLLPFGMVKLTGLMLGTSGPATATASVHEQPAPFDVQAISRPVPQWTPEQLAAAAYIQAIADERDGTPPLLYPRTQATTDPVEALEPPEGLDVEVNLIMAARTGNVALIDGAPRRVGDIVQSSWRIEVIDSGSRSVTFVNTSTDERVTARVATPY